MEIITKIQGISHHQETLKKCKVGDTLKLKREPNNPYDKYAVAIYTLNGELLGYISKYHNMRLNLDLDSGFEFGVEIKAITGKDKETWGCNIQIYEKTPKDFFVGDGLIRFSQLSKYVVFSTKNYSLSISKEDFEKCYKHYIRTTEDKKDE